VDLIPGSAIPCVVSFAPGQERRVYFAVAGLQLRRLSHHEPGAERQQQHSALLHSLPVAVLADPAPSKLNAGVVLSVAPLLGADPSVDKGVGKWLHVHVRPSVRGLLRVLKVGRRGGRVGGWGGEGRGRRWCPPLGPAVAGGPGPGGGPAPIHCGPRLAAPALRIYCSPPPSQHTHCCGCAAHRARAPLTAPQSCTHTHPPAPFFRPQ
jgi:hypothetical protein